ncbi:SurA N-terminal domain-containing protein [Candidatus Mesenet endosymbiont of Agriotes lineatus]|uniref:SurA N-terminal domain-containing protein n=1 Tax=Candidatus Mesenet endosymbiont of Agriotes lineatus TaxID=3077948 RepID=UPI0030D56ABB
MNKLAIIFLLLSCIFTNVFASVKIVATVNGELISSLDVEKRMLSMEHLGIKTDQKQVLQSLIDEVLIENQAKKLKVSVSNNELNGEILLFSKRFKLNYDEFVKQVKNNYVGYGSIIKQIKSQLLWNKISELKILSFINISNEEVNNIAQQIDRISVIINVLEILIPNKSNSSYNTAVNIVQKLRNNETLETIVKDYTEFPVSIQKEALNIMQLPSKLQNMLGSLNIGDISDPIAVDGAYLVVKVADKIKFDPSLLDTTLSLKQIYLLNNQEKFKEYCGKLDNLKNQKVDCLMFDRAVENLGLPKVEKIEVKMGELAPYMQAPLQKLQVGEIIDIKDNKGNLRLIMLCNIQKKYVGQHEWIKQKIYEQKVSTQSAIYFDNMRKNATIAFR